MTGWLVPAAYGAGEYTEKRSRFIGQVWPVESEAEALRRIEAVRRDHYDARHNVFAYSLREGNVLRCSDDGEPQGTGGQPVLNVFRGAQVQDFCCVVTRYFGGVLLGTGGLARAYAAAAKAALEAAGMARMALWHTLLIPCDYPRFERVKRLLEQYEAVIEGVLMKGEERWGLAVRRPGGDIFTEHWPNSSRTKRLPWKLLATC